MKTRIYLWMPVIFFALISYASMVRASDVVNFNAAQYYNVGNGPYALAVGDLNGDGNDDIVTVNTYDDNISVLLGNGNGTFQAAVNYPTAVGAYPYAPAVGDLNGDGQADIVTANADLGNVSILLGNGNGTFQLPVDYSTDSGPHWVAIGDLNGDNWLDIATANADANTVSVLLGNGDGSFQGNVDYPTAGMCPIELDMYDLNNDGHLDLLVANYNSTEDSDNLSILLGNGDGTFQDAVTYAAGLAARSIAEGDFNRDGRPDIATANWDASVSYVKVLLGNGDGTFQAAIAYPAGNMTRSIAAADFNFDRNPDIAVTNYNNDNVSILLGNGDGTFDAPINFGAADGPHCIALGDFNGDNNLDISIADDSAGNVAVLLNNRAHVFVNIDNAGSEDGNSWATGYKTIQAGIDAADAGDKEVWVKVGTYFENITLKEGVALFGGFNGTETAQNQRDWDGNPTTISAAGLGAGVVIGKSNSRIDGFIITGGNAQGSTVNGGGIYNNNVSSLFVANCILSNNNALNGSGGAIYNSQSYVIVENCVFSTNVSRGSGGAIHNNNGSSLFVKDSTFIGNSSQISSGGGICNDSDSFLTVRNCIFHNNTADFRGGGICSWNNAASSISISNSLIYDNTAGQDGGGIAHEVNSNAVITNCTITGNTASTGGGGGIAAVATSSPIITNCILWGNTASYSNEIYKDGTSNPIVTYCDVSGGFAGAGNINVDPLFYSSTDFRLKPGSPCIDSADSGAGPALDFADQSRYDDPATVNTGTGSGGTYYDIGVYEFQGSWTRVNPDSFRVPDNYSAYQMVAFNNKGYIGIWGNNGALVWEYDSAVDDWNDITPAWGATNAGVNSLEVYNNKLYAGTYGSPVSPVSPSQVWSYDGASWTDVSDGSWGASQYAADSMTVFDGKLYVAMAAASGVELWAYDGASWVLTNTAGFGDPGNSRAYSMVAYNGKLYAGTMNVSGTQVWATDGAGGAPYTWTQINSDGFNDNYNMYAWSMSVYGGDLYVGTYNSMAGSEIWRTGGVGGPPYTDWSQVNSDGFNDSTNTNAKCMTVYDGQLYVGTWNQTTGGEVWATDGTGGPPYTWTQVNDDGFGNANNWYVNSMGVLADTLYVGTYNEATGLEIWELNSGVIETVQYTLTVNTSGSGSVSLNPSGGIYDALSGVTLTAVPADGWAFAGWSGDLSGTTNPATIIMDSNKVISPDFTEIDTSGTAFHGAAGEAYFEWWADRGHTLIDFESLSSPMALDTQLLATYGVEFHSIADPGGSAIYKNVAVAFLSSSYTNTIIGVPSWGGATGNDGRVTYEISFATPQKRAGLIRHWDIPGTITRFYNSHDDLIFEYEDYGTGWARYFFGYEVNSSEEVNWIKRIVCTGKPSGSEQVGHSDEIIFGSDTLPAINPGQYYVDITQADDSGDGTSPATAWKTIHHALNMINFAGNPGSYVLNIAPGVYSLENGEADFDLGIFNNNVTIQGGGVDDTIIDGTGASDWNSGFIIDASNAVVANLSITGFADPSERGVTFYSGTTNVVKSCDISDNYYGLYIEAASSNNTIGESCSIYHNGNGIVIDRSHDNLIFGNLGSIYDNGTSEVPGRGVEIRNDSYNNRIYQNRIFWSGDDRYIQGEGIEISYAGTGNEIYQNEIYGHSSNGIDIYDSSPAARQNEIHDNSTGIYLVSYEENISPLIENNLFYRSAEGSMDHAIEIYSDGSALTPEIYHNTIDGTQTCAITVMDFGGGAAPVIKYNIISNSGGCGINNDAAYPGNPVSDWNHFYNNTSGDQCNFTGGVDDNTGNEDPLYGSYELQPGSPCIDAVPADVGDPVTEDFNGASRPLGSGFDQGCYEIATDSLFFTLTLETVGSGTVVKSPSQATYAYGTEVSLTATAGAESIFQDWTGDYSGTDNPVTLVMDSNLTIAARFNSYPDAPAAVSPVEEYRYDSTSSAALAASSFTDQDSDSHVASHWRVRESGSVYGRSDYDGSFDQVVTSGALTTHTINGLADGMRYLWQVGYVDSGSGVTSWSAESSFKIGTSATEEIDPIEGGTTQADFRMTSFTSWPESPSCAGVFQLSYDPQYYRIGTYCPALGGYREYGSFDVQPGRAYWVLARDGLDITYEGVPVSLVRDIEVELYYNPDTQNGWNMIGCPNDAAYYWEGVQVVVYDNEGGISFGPVAVGALSDTNAYLDVRVWDWESGSYTAHFPDDSFLLLPHGGYWVKAKASNVYLIFGAGQQAALANPVSMFASLLNKGRRWANKVFTPKTAIADSGDSPPLPMPGLGHAESGSSGAGGGGCFLSVIGKQ